MEEGSNEHTILCGGYNAVNNEECTILNYGWEKHVRLLPVHIGVPGGHIA